MIKQAHAAFAGRYFAALRVHLGRKRAALGARAQRLGRTALAGGLVTRDLALIHEKAVLALASSHDFTNRRNGASERAELFFTQALGPLETAQQAARESNEHLRRRNETLRQHTAALARGNRRLEREVARRREAEAVVRVGRAQYQKLFLESLLMQKKLRQLTRQILSAQEEERKKISRELHDEVVQTLVGINVQLTALGAGASSGLHAFKAKIARTRRLVENSVKEVHRFARELRPAVLDDLGLIPALHAYSKGLAARKKIKIRLTAFAGIEVLGIAPRTVLYRVAQEALTNVVRHAEASLVRINLTSIQGVVRMEISDDGKSFPVEKTLLAKSHGRLGLIGMKERVEMVGGKLTIASAPGQGTTVFAEIPFPSTKAKK